MNNIEDLFEKTDKSFDMDGLEDVYDIDIDSIDEESNTKATGSINNLLKLYNNKEFIENHPEFKKRIDTEIESLRKLYKMSKVNETLHDHLAKSIANNPGNASLYMAVAKIQDKVLAIDKEIKTIMNEFNKLCTSYQTEINFQNATELEVGQPQEDKNGGISTRGSKAFIEQMNLLEDEDNLE